MCLKIKKMGLETFLLIVFMPRLIRRGFFVFDYNDVIKNSLFS
jgi:hypothetical protein